MTSDENVLRMDTRLRVSGPDRYRLDFSSRPGRNAPTTIACDGERRWQVYPDLTMVGPAAPLAGHIAFLADACWLLRGRLSGGTELTYRGRPARQLRVTRAPGGEARLPGPLMLFAAPADAIVDAETGCLLRLLSYHGDALATWRELDDISTEPVNPDEFQVHVPPGTRTVEETGNPFADTAAVMPGVKGTAARAATEAVNRTAGAVSGGSSGQAQPRPPAPPGPGPAARRAGGRDHGRRPHSGALDGFHALTVEQRHDNLQARFYGQADPVLTGQHHCNDGASFTLTSGIFAGQAWPRVTGGAIISGALHSFVLSAALELPRGMRVNVVSPNHDRRLSRRLRRRLSRHATSADGQAHRALPAMRRRDELRPDHPRQRLTGHGAQSPAIRKASFGQPGGERATHLKVSERQRGIRADQSIRMRCCQDTSTSRRYRSAGPARPRSGTQADPARPPVSVHRGTMGSQTGNERRGVTEDA